MEGNVPLLSAHVPLMSLPLSCSCPSHAHVPLLMSLKGQGHEQKVSQKHVWDPFFLLTFVCFQVVQSNFEVTVNKG